jgi:hypothetical protein
MHSNRKLETSAIAMIHPAASLPGLSHAIESHYHNQLDDVITELSSTRMAISVCRGVLDWVSNPTMIKERNTTRSILSMGQPTNCMIPGVQVGFCAASLLVRICVISKRIHQETNVTIAPAVGDGTLKQLYPYCRQKQRLVCFLCHLNG